MSRYYFHLVSDREHPDEEGVDLDGLHEARCYAVRMIAEVLCNDPERYWENEMYRVIVADESGLTLFMVELVSFDAAAIGTETSRRR